MWDKIATPGNFKPLVVIVENLVGNSLETQLYFSVVVSRTNKKEIKPCQKAILKISTLVDSLLSKLNE